MINWFNTYAPFCKMPESETPPEYVINPYWVGPTNDGRLSLRITGSTLYMTKAGAQQLIDTLNIFVQQLPDEGMESE